MGSYALDTMVWRDLDVTLEAPSISVSDFFVLGGSLVAQLNPIKMSFRNERLARSPGLPIGLYWGMYLGDERAGAWKIDVWAVDVEHIEKDLALRKTIVEKLTPKSRRAILEIKSRCWQDPGYRRDFYALDIYKAVLDAGVTDINGFRSYLTRTKGV